METSFVLKKIALLVIFIDSIRKKDSIVIHRSKTVAIRYRKDVVV